MSILEGSLAKAIGKGTSKLFYAATLVRTAAGAGPGFNPGAPTTTTYPCKGIVDTFSAYERQNGQIQAGDVKVLILATSLAVEPVAADKVTIRGVTYAVEDVSTDPARAVWVLQGRA